MHLTAHGTKHRSPPRDLAELLLRAQALTGRTVGELAQALGAALPTAPQRSKGTCGILVERALGARAGSLPGPDFSELGIELKTLPINRRGRPKESTFVCALNLSTITSESWPTSTVRRKLARVLFMPVEGSDSGPLPARRFLSPLLFDLGGLDEEHLQADWEDLVGRIGVGGVSGLSARVGRCLQVRPKAARGSVRVAVAVPLEEDGWGGGVTLCPRGFYLRTGFTGRLLARRTTG